MKNLYIFFYAELTIELASRFINKEVVIHSGGHYFPATVKEREIFKKFFLNRLEDHLIRKEIDNAKDAQSIMLNEDVSSDEN